MTALVNCKENVIYRDKSGLFLVDIFISNDLVSIITEQLANFPQIQRRIQNSLLGNAADCSLTMRRRKTIFCNIDRDISIIPAIKRQIHIVGNGRLSGCVVMQHIIQNAAGIVYNIAVIVNHFTACVICNNAMIIFYCAAGIIPNHAIVVNNNAALFIGYEIIVGYYLAIVFIDDSLFTVLNNNAVVGRYNGVVFCNLTIVDIYQVVILRHNAIVFNNSCVKGILNNNSVIYRYYAIVDINRATVFCHLPVIGDRQCRRRQCDQKRSQQKGHSCFLKCLSHINVSLELSCNRVSIFSPKTNAERNSLLRIIIIQVSKDPPRLPVEHLHHNSSEEHPFR